MDVCEIGSHVDSCGQIKTVKPLGAFVILDEGQPDWKIVAIDISNCCANELSDFDDVEMHFPGYLGSDTRCLMGNREHGCTWRETHEPPVGGFLCHFLIQSYC